MIIKNAQSAEIVKTTVFKPKKCMLSVLKVVRYTMSDTEVFLSDLSPARRKVYCIQYEVFGIVVRRKVFRILYPKKGDVRISLVKSKERIKKYMLEYTIYKHYKSNYSQRIDKSKFIAT